MKTQEISVTIDHDGTIKLPKSFVESLRPGQSIRLLAVTDKTEDQLLLPVSAEHFFADDDPADQLYADCARKAVK